MKKQYKKIKEYKSCKPNYCCCPIIGPTGPTGPAGGPTGPTGATGAIGPTDTYDYFFKLINRNYSSVIPYKY